MSSILWFAGFAMMMLSFTFLVGGDEPPERPRISVEPWFPTRTDEQGPSQPD
jgi:hypothetical protein